MQLINRYIKIGMIAAVAAFFTVIAFNNMTDPEPNLLRCSISLAWIPLV